MIVSAKLVAALLVSIHGYTGYAIPGDPPHVRMLPHAELAYRVCGADCGVLGFTTPEGEVLLDDSLPVGVDPTATSILVHELTHFLQVRSSEGPLATDCASWREREREAYDVQIRWLRDQAPNLRTFSLEMAALDLHPTLPECAGNGNALVAPQP